VSVHTAADRVDLQARVSDSGREPETLMDEHQRAQANAAQLASPSYRLASQDPDFLMGESMRALRFQLEFSKVEEALKAWGVRVDHRGLRLRAGAARLALV
jgi:hypothetical protein